MIIKKLIKYLLYLAITAGFLFPATENIIINDQTERYGYVNGTENGLTPGTAVLSLYGSNGLELDYSYPDGGWAGLGVALPTININSYTRFVVSIKCDTPIIAITFINTNNVGSELFYISEITGNVFQNIEINLQAITGNFERTAVTKMQFQIKEAGNNKHLYIQNLAFDTIPSAVSLNTPLSLVPAYQGVNGGTVYPSLVPESTYFQTIQNVWLGYKKRYIEAYQAIASPTAYGLVYDPFVGNSSTAIEASDYCISESSGYGLLLAVFMNDKNTFDQILNATYRTIYKPSTGLFSWRVYPTGTINPGDENSAMDGDEDIALALIFADTLQKKGVWATTTNYYNKAQNLIDAIYNKDFEYARYVRLGDYFNGGRTLTNLSYFSPAWYKIFSRYENKFHDWKPIIEQGYKTLTLSSGYNNGLAPDWCDSYGQPLSGRAYEVGKEAIRVFLRLGIDAVWFNDSRATTFLGKTRDFIVNNSRDLSTIRILNMSGTSVGSYDDVSLTSMYVAGAMGSADTNYRSTAKSALDRRYLMYVNSGQYSFFSSEYYPPGRFNYYNQSLALLSCLLLSGGLPNVFQDLTNPGLPPVLQSSNLPSAFYNKSVNCIPFVISCNAGGAYVATVDIYISHSAGNLTLQLNKETYPSISVISDATNSLQESSVEYAISNNNLLITLNLLISNNWVQGPLTIKWMAQDYKNNKVSSWQDLSSSKTFYPYEAEYLGVNSTNLKITNISIALTTNIIKLPNQFVFSAGTGPWSIAVFTDNNPLLSGQAGFALTDTSGNIQHFIPINVLVTSNAITPSNLSDAGWVTANDRQDAVSSIVLSNSLPQLLATKNVYLGFKASTIRAGRYSATLYYKLSKDTNLLIDSFDFPDTTLMSDLNSYWSAIPLYTTNTAIPTATTINIVANSFNGSNSLKTTYTLGSINYLGYKPQAITSIDLNNTSTARNISGYTGISFWIKAESDTPLAVFLVSPLVVNSDYHLAPLHPIANKWCKYTLYFKDFYQQGYAPLQTVSLSSALNQIQAIQFRTLSEKQGETQSFYLDNIWLF